MKIIVEFNEKSHIAKRFVTNSCALEYLPGVVILRQGHEIRHMFPLKYIKQVRTVDGD